MKSILATIVVLCGIAFPVIAQDTKQLDTDPADQAAAKQAEHDRIAWVVKCMKDFQAIKKGMTRKQVAQRLRFEAGIQGDPVRFTHPECPYFKVDVTFAPDGTVAKVSRPYMGWAIID